VVVVEQTSSTFKPLVDLQVAVHSLGLSQQVLRWFMCELLVAAVADVAELARQQQHLALEELAEVVVLQATL
jgi:hypothetical protein